MMKFLIILMLVFVRVTSVFADFECQITLKPNGQELKELQNIYDDLVTYSAFFQQRSYLASLGVEDISSGELWVAKPNKTRWSYLLPEKSEYLIKDQSFWHYQSAIGQLQISDLAESSLSALPTDLLTGQVDFSESFDLSLLCTNKAGDNILTLLPKSEDLGVVNVKLITHEHKIIAIEFIDQAGNTNSIELSNIKWNPIIKDDIFTINYPSETFLNDLRQL